MGSEGREGGGESWKVVQHPDGLVDEAVSQSAGSGLEAPHSPPRGQEVLEAVGGVVGVDVECFAGQSCAVNVLKGGEGGTDDPLSCSYYALQGLPAGYSPAAVPHSDAAGQDALGGLVRIPLPEQTDMQQMCTEKRNKTQFTSYINRKSDISYM